MLNKGYEQEEKETEVKPTDAIKRDGKRIVFGDGYAAIEGMDGDTRTLTIKKGRKVIETYRGSSLSFCDELTEEDKEYLNYLKKASVGNHNLETRK